MNLDESSVSCCIVCGKDLTNAPGVTYLYQGGRRFALCCPMCIEMFQRAPARFASGERPKTIVEELVSDLKWRSGA